MAALDSGAIEQLITNFDERPAFRDSWRDARLLAALPSSADPLLLDPTDITASSFQMAIKRHRRELQRSSAVSSADQPGLRLPSNYAGMGPSARIKAIKPSYQASTRVERFLQERTQANLLKQVRGSLPAISSALKRYIAFWGIRETRPFPPTEQLVPAWSSVLADTAAFANYISHLQKVCFFVGCPASWLTPAVRHVAKGLKKCQGKSFRFLNFVRSRLLARIIRHESDSSEFAQA